jgi:hypothetical protein
MMAAAGIGLVWHGEKDPSGRNSAAPYRATYLHATRWPEYALEITRSRAGEEVVYMYRRAIIAA